jgi:hypothetical protein
MRITQVGSEAAQPRWATGRFASPPTGTGNECVFGMGVEWSGLQCTLLWACLDPLRKKLLVLPLQWVGKKEMCAGVWSVWSMAQCCAALPPPLMLMLCRKLGRASSDFGENGANNNHPSSRYVVSPFSFPVCFPSPFPLLRLTSFPLSSSPPPLLHLLVLHPTITIHSFKRKVMVAYPCFCVRAPLLSHPLRYASSKNRMSVFPTQHSSGPPPEVGLVVCPSSLESHMPLSFSW